MSNHYKHAAQMSMAVHDGLVRWIRRLMEEADLEEIEIWGRFPPEGTVRSYMVLFPYRVGPGPLIMENAPGTSLLLPTKGSRELLASVPWAWREVARLLSQGMGDVYGDASSYRPGDKLHRNPYPMVDKLPKALGDWYRAKPDDSDWLVRTATDLHAKMPSLAWRPGTRTTVHYLAVANDPGRGTSSRMSDAAPIALPALTVLTTGIQLERMVEVKVPPRPLPEGLLDYLTAFIEGWAECGADDQDLSDLREAVAALTEAFDFKFHVAPLNDLNDQEFALLTQALQRPLQAVLNVRIRFPVGLHAEFEPSAMVSPRQPTRKTR